MVWPNFVRALSHRNFRLYFSGQVVSLVGTWMQNVAMSWLAYRIGHLVFLLGAISFAQQIPMLVVSPFVGNILDRIDRLKLLRVTQTLSMIPASVAAWLTLSGHVQVWHLVLLAGVLGMINSIDVPARQSIIVSLVEERADMANAIAMNSLAINGARLIGPAVAGLIVAGIGEGLCFLLNAVSYLAVIAALFRVRIQRPSAKMTRLPGGLRQGFQYAIRSPEIRTLLAITAVTSFLVAPYVVVMPYFARDVFQGDARLLGWLLGCSGSGAILASIFLLSRPHMHSLAVGLRSAALIGAIATVCFSASHTLWFSMLMLVLMGFGMIVTAAACNTLIQSIVPDELRGRVMSMFSACYIGLIPIGSLLVSSIAHLAGVPATIGACAALGALILLNLRRQLEPLVQKLASGSSV
jgi:MFS family permease